MSTYSLTHLDDGVLLRDLAALVARDRATTAELLAHIAEVDTRRLYVPAGYPSMYLYCVHELHLSEDVAFKRIYVARLARRFPGIYGALADGRLHLTALVLLGPYLTQEAAAGLLEAAEHKCKTEIEALLAQRFPKPDVPTRVEPITPALNRLAEPAAPGVPALQCSPGSVDARSGTDTAEPPQHVPEHVGAFPAQHVPEHVGAPLVQHVPEHVGTSGERARVRPLAPDRFALQVTIAGRTREKLRYAQELLGHQIPSGDVAHVLDRALDALIHRLEAQKFAATSRPRREPRRTRGRRTIPAAVKRAVWERDGGRCTYVSDRGQRCPARSRLEFDHIDPVARGGEATVAGMRLRCRAHNQYEAERTFGAGFMSGKRRAAVEARVRTAGGRSHPCVSRGGTSDTASDRAPFSSDSR
jgi:5-methylcytosine-specific restriction endonuclease McrA